MRRERGEEWDGFGGGEGRPGRTLYAAPPNGWIQRSGGAAPHQRSWGRAGVGFGGGSLVGRADLVPGIGPLSGRLISGRASGRPAVLGLWPKH
jgi:hypothetical protein